MRIRVLTTPWQKMLGAMSERKLGSLVLVFPYRKAGRRIFHTFACPPLRIIGLNDEGHVTFDRVVMPNSFVVIPDAKFVVEADPTFDLDVTAVWEHVKDFPLLPRREGGWSTADEAFGDLFRYMLRDAFKSLVAPECFHQATFDERVEMVDAAGFLIDTAINVMDIPRAFWEAARRIWQTCMPEDRLEYLLAAEYGRASWLKEMETCCMCGERKGRWHRVILHEPVRAAEWRYRRPENHVPLCRHCAYVVRWYVRPDVRYRAAYIMWNARFRALLKWHRAYRAGTLPAAWDRITYPLWPPEFGGETWEAGSGHVDHARPRCPSLDDEARRELLALRKAFQNVVFRGLKAAS